MDFSNSKPVDIARYYAECGWRVLPVMANEKRPAIANGVKGATADAELLASYFGELSKNGNHPNIGIATGAESGFFVVDIDVKNCDDAFLNAAELLGYDDLCDPETIQVDTPSGGQHWYFKMPKHGIGNYTGIVSGVDIKGDGGYVLGPGSVIDGRPYAFSRDGEIAEAPKEFLERLESRTTRNGNGTLTWDDTAGAPEGSRNNALFRYGCRLINFGMAPNEILAAMQVRNQSYRPPLDDDEIQGIAKSIVSNYGRDIPFGGPRNRLLTMTELEAMPRPVPLISDVLYSNMEHVLFGPQGTSKTFLLLDWFLHIVHGQRWQDKNVQTGNVVYVCGEGGGRVLADRLAVWHKHNNLDKTLTDERFRITEFPVPLLQDEAVEELLALVHDWGNVLAIGIDTLSANFGPGDENSQADMGRFCAAVRRIRLETHAGTIVVHHTGHVDKTRPQGANRIRRDFDIELRVDADSSDEHLYGLLGGGRLKNRNGKGCGLIPYRLKTVRLDDDGGFGEAVESAVVVPTMDTPQFEGQRDAPAKGRGKNQYKVIDALTYMAEKTGQRLDDEDGVHLTAFDMDDAFKFSKMTRKRWNEVLRNFHKQGITRPAVDGIKWYPQ
jgi:hypothetical protein